MRGLFFIATSQIGANGFLNKEDILELVRRGHQVGSHSHSHQEMSSLSENEIREEWKTSVRILSELQGEDKPVIASIPNGDYNKKILNYAVQANISNIYTSDPTLKPRSYKGMTMTGRYVVYNGMTIETVLGIIDKESVRRKMLIKWRVINCLKLILGRNYNKVKGILMGKK